MIKNCELGFEPEEITDMLHRHTRLDANKIVSYLPLNTIENVIGMPLDIYTSIVENNVGGYIIFNEDECRIYSGAVYAFLPNELEEILKKTRIFLL
jgi:hypothetical protein